MSRRRRRSQPSPDGKQPFNRASAAGLILLGVIMGLMGALYYAWVVAPIVYTEVAPSRLSERYKEEYIYLVSQSYATNGDWAQAERRLAALEDPILNQRVAALLETYLREQAEPQVIENMARLAQRLGVENKAVALFAPTPAGPIPTPTVIPTTAAPHLHRLPPPAKPPRPPSRPALPLPPPPSPAPQSPSPHLSSIGADAALRRGEPVALLVVETQDALLNPYRV
ncbi:MAG: hypothetical protein M5U34_22740 [Chloroflexi bacterium]|nr:hypothetical protein [Chloroflexota bacterium]